MRASHNFADRTMILDTIQSVLDQTQNRRLYAVLPSASVAEAVQIMCGNETGAVLAIEAGKLEGMLSERDILTKVVARRLDPATTPVAEAMHRDLPCVSGSTMVDEAMSLMVKRGLSHLPVIAANHGVVGMLSSGDLVRWILGQQDEQVNTAIRAVRALALSSRRGGNS